MSTDVQRKKCSLTHDGQNRHQSNVKLATQPPLGSVIKHASRLPLVDLEVLIITSTDHPLIILPRSGNSIFF